jgi:hypothetical protein
VSENGRGRGPDLRELALDRCTRALLAGLAEEERLERVLDELHKAQAQALELGITPPRSSFRRVMAAAVQVHRGDAFWEREPAEPTPLEVAR